MSGTRSGPVTFGQLSVIRSLGVHGPGGQSVANLVNAWNVPAGTRTARVVDAWLWLVKAHESLRTTYDLSGARPIQIVHPFRPAQLPVVELEADTPAAVALAAAAWAVDPIAIDEALPWRAFVAEYRGAPVCLCTVIHHVAVDYGALRVLEAQFGQLLRGRPPTPAGQPLDMALAQQVDPARIRRDIAPWIEAWGEIVASDRDPADASERRRASVYSTAALAAAKQLSERLRVSVPSILLSVGALVLSRVVQRESLTFALMSANRLDSRWTSIVGSLNQYAPLTLAVDESANPSTYLRDTYVKSLNAYMHGVYDVDVLKHGLREHGLDDPDPTAFARHFNFLGDIDAEPDVEAQIRTGVAWRPSTQRSGPNLHLVTAVGEGLLIGVGASLDCLPDELPALLAASIEAGIIGISQESGGLLRDVCLEPVRSV